LLKTVDKDNRRAYDREMLQSYTTNISNTSSSSHFHRSLGVKSVIVLCYFNVSGGPWGAEGIISAAGPFVGLISCIIFPIVWSLPVALVTAELCCVFPDNGGYSLWVNEAFGPFWAFQESYWSWTSGVVDNATYPVLFYGILCHLFNGIHPNVPGGIFDNDDDDDLSAQSSIFVMDKEWWSGYALKSGVFFSVCGCLSFVFKSSPPPC
jgi:amino acid transporter